MHVVQENVFAVENANSQKSKDTWPPSFHPRDDEKASRHLFVAASHLAPSTPMTSSALASIKAPAAALRAPAAVSRARGRVAVAPIRAVSTAAEGSALREIVAEISGAAGACPLLRRGRSIPSVVVARTSRRPGPSPRRVRCLFSLTRRTPRRGVSPTSPRRRIAQPPVASCLRRRHPDHSPFFPIPPLPERRGLTDHHRPAPPDVLLRSRRARQEAHRHVRLPPRAPGRGQVHRQPRHGLHRRGVVRVSLFS